MSAGVGVCKILPTPTPTPAKIADSDSAALILMIPGGMWTFTSPGYGTVWSVALLSHTLRPVSAPCLTCAVIPHPVYPAPLSSSPPSSRAIIQRRRRRVAVRKSSAVGSDAGDGGPPAPGSSESPTFLTYLCYCLPGSWMILVYFYWIILISCGSFMNQFTSQCYH